MYMTDEDYAYHEKMFNGLDNDKAHDYMDQLMSICRRITGKEEWVITVRSAKAISALEVPQEHIITRKMVDDAYLSIAIGPHDEDEVLESPS